MFSEKRYLIRKPLIKNYSNIMFKIAIGGTSMDKVSQKACSQYSQVSLKIFQTNQNWKKTVFIGNDKSNLTIHQKWVTEKTKQHYKQRHQTMNPSDAKN